MTSKIPTKPQMIDSSLKTLSISSKKPSRPPMSTAPPESWDEEAASSITLSSTSATPSPPSTPVADATPGPPPPTPISPSHRRGKSTDWSSFPASAPSRSSPQETNGGISSTGKAEKRPEKSSATASRMIAGALGVKSPKMTEEHRRFEKAVREKERKRIESEKEEGRRREREKAEAQKAIWDD